MLRPNQPVLAALFVALVAVWNSLIRVDSAAASAAFVVVPSSSKMASESASSSCALPATQQPSNNDNDGSSTKKNCIPCSTLDPSFLLSDNVIRQRLESSLPLWQLSTTPVSLSSNHGSDKNKEKTTTANCIERRFVAQNFQAALDAINAMGAIAEEQGHHPDFHLTSYRNVAIVIWTHSVGGVTENDLTLAQLLDQRVSVRYSPKWLKDHPQAKSDTTASFLANPGNAAE